MSTRELIRTPKGQCCCDPCYVKVGCDGNTTGGITAEEGFYGLCCNCVPRFACIELIESYDILGSNLIDPITVEWDEGCNCYSVSFNIEGHPPVDIRIGFENGPGEFLGSPNVCYLVLASECMNYKRQGLFGTGYEMEDTRLFVRLYDTEYDEPSRRTVCRELDVEFQIDLGRCTEDGYEGPPELVTVRIRPAEWLSRGQRLAGEVSDYDCFYRRVCITYKKDGDRIDQYACVDDDYQFWQTTFPDIDGEPLTVTITKDGTDLSLQTDTGINGEPVAADCPDMFAEWDIGYGATIEIKGDKRADCIDCKCFPRELCVQLANDFDEPIWRGTVTWEEYDDFEGYIGTLVDESAAGADPVIVALHFWCDECSGQTYMQWGDHKVAITCPEPSGAFIVVEANNSNTVLTFEPKGCADCFSASYAPCNACPGGVPRTLYLTVVTTSNSAAQTCIEGKIIPLFWATHPGGSFWSGVMHCDGCLDCPTPDPSSLCTRPIIVTCGDNEYEPFILTFGGVSIPQMPGTSGTCAPYAEFGEITNGPSGLFCSDREPLGAEDPDFKFKLVLSA